MNKQSAWGVTGVIIGITITKLIFTNPGMFHYVFTCGVIIGIGISVKSFFDIFKKQKRKSITNEAISETAVTLEATNNMIENKPFYYGFGGWLYLVSIGQLSTLYTTVSTIFETDIPMLSKPEWKTLTDPQSVNYNAIWKPFVYFEIVGCSIFILLIFLIGYLTIKLSKYYKRAQISLYIFNVAYSLIAMTFMISINSYYSPPLYSQDDFVKIIVQTTVASLIWIPYFMVSKRVKNTFNK